ncbi:MAG: phosphodiesterase [Clostridia bacterium]|nr:phosphodiesterase [Clostridia bacterium]
MKFLIASDLHGSAYYAKLVAQAFKTEGADKLILLGDIYNHGPRNPFPTDYAPMEVAKVLNGLKSDIIVVKGNCDSEVDTLISEFDFIPEVCLVSGGKTVLLTHGHIHNKDEMPKTEFDCVIYGHFHTCFSLRQGKTLVVNAGSVALPKDGTANSYVVLDGDRVTLKDFGGKIIADEII